MSFLTIFQNAEAAIENFIKKLVAEGEATIAEVEQALNHVASLLPAIAPEVTAATTFVEGLGAVSGHPEVAAAAAAMQTAVNGLSQVAQAYSTATAPGAGITASQAENAILTGYQGYNETKAAVRTLVATATKVAGQNQAAKK